MRQVITTYFIVVVLLALGFFGVGALAKAAELSDPMQPRPWRYKSFVRRSWLVNLRPLQSVHSGRK